MQQNRTSHLGLIFILGLLSMLMPLAIDMYLPSMPVIAAQFGVESGSVQMTSAPICSALPSGSCSMGQCRTASAASR